MIRMMKLLLLVLTGYVLYEFYQGFSETSAPETQPRRGGSRSRGQKRRVPITGGGEGAVTRTHDVSGTSTPVRVGRGVKR